MKQRLMYLIFTYRSILLSIFPIIPKPLIFLQPRYINKGINTNMVRLFKICFIFCLFVISSVAKSETNFIKNTHISPLNKVLIAEGLFLVNSWMASESPNTYGAIAALLFPIGAAGGNESATTKWVGFLSAESLAIYNINLDEDKENKSDIFKNNMIGWHIFAGLTGLTGYIMGDFDSDESLSLLPLLSGGAQFVYSNKFKYNKTLIWNICSTLALPMRFLECANSELWQGTSADSQKLTPKP